MSKYLVLKATAEANKWAKWYFSDKIESLEVINNAKRLFIQKYIDSYKVK